MLTIENAITSWWVPCEIGVASQMKIVEKIAIVYMVRNYNTEFKGNEYLKLYRCIQIDSLYIIKPFLSSVIISLFKHKGLVI